MFRSRILFSISILALLLVAAENLPAYTQAGQLPGNQASITKNIVSIASQDGWLLESSENSNVGRWLNTTATRIRLGDDAVNRQYRSILSFNTASIPDNAKISSVTLVLDYPQVVGTNPFTILGKLLVDIHSGSFSDSPALQLADFNASPTAAKVSQVINNYPLQSFIGLSAVGRSKINKTGLTQLRLYFEKDDNNNQKADYITFTSANYDIAEAQPFLMITYTLP